MLKKASNLSDIEMLETFNCGNGMVLVVNKDDLNKTCLLYTSPSPRDRQKSRMPSSA